MPSHAAPTTTTHPNTHSSLMELPRVHGGDIGSAAAKRLLDRLKDTKRGRRTRGFVRPQDHALDNWCKEKVEEEQEEEEEEEDDDEQEETKKKRKQ